MNDRMKKKLEDMRSTPVATMSPAAAMQAERRRAVKAAASQSKIVSLPLPSRELKCPECAVPFATPLLLEKHRYELHERVRVNPRVPKPTTAVVQSTQQAAASQAPVAPQAQQDAQSQLKDLPGYYTPADLWPNIGQQGAAQQVWPSPTVVTTLVQNAAPTGIPASPYCCTVGSQDAGDGSQGAHYSSMPQHLCVEPQAADGGRKAITSGTVNDFEDAAGSHSRALAAAIVFDNEGEFDRVSSSMPLPVTTTFSRSDMDYLAVRIAVEIELSRARRKTSETPK